MRINKLKTDPRLRVTLRIRELSITHRDITGVVPVVVFTVMILLGMYLYTPTPLSYRGVLKGHGVYILSSVGAPPCLRTKTLLSKQTVIHN